MRGYHTAKTEYAEFLSDIPTESLSKALLEDWAEKEREYNSQYKSTIPYEKLREAYSEIGELTKEVRELRELLTIANDMIGQD